jgi:uncharacterized protein (DUF1697 family)
MLGAVNTWIALFRGINVGGHGILPMKKLVALLEGLGCRNVATYIQSGNAVFQSAEADAGKLTKRIEAAVKAGCGFEPRVLVLSAGELQKAARANPFPQAREAPQFVHLMFLAEAPQGPNVAALKQAKTSSENFALKGKVFYLYTPDGAGNSRLAGRAEHWLGVAATGRNWNTVTKLIEMAKAAE